jgi:hypothetical protein
VAQSREKWVASRNGCTHLSASYAPFAATVRARCTLNLVKGLGVAPTRRLPRCSDLAFRAIRAIAAAPNARDSPFRFGISLSGVGAPLKAPFNPAVDLFLGELVAFHE